MKLAIGTVQFGVKYGVANRHGKVTHDDARAIIELSRASGLNTLDTAISYGDCEQRLGEIGIGDWRVVSKLPAIPANCDDIAQWVTGGVAGSLQRLKVKSLYGVLLHCPHQLLERHGDQLYIALQRLKHSGLVHKIGISIYAPTELDAFFGHYKFDLIQAPFSILDRRLIDTGWLSRLADQGSELHVRSIFLQGLLLMKPSDRPPQFTRWSILWSQWDDWLKYSGQTPLQACLRYALSFPQIGRVIVGVDSVPQLREVLAASKGVSPQIPDDIKTSDVELLNPANWAALC